jgi:hypothetical protein
LAGRDQRRLSRVRQSAISWIGGGAEIVDTDRSQEAPDSVAKALLRKGRSIDS